MSSTRGQPKKQDPIDLLPANLARLVKRYFLTHPPDVKPPFVTQGSQPLKKDPRSGRKAAWQHTDGYLVEPRYQYIGRSSWKVIVLHHTDRPAEIIASAKAAGQVTTRTKNEDTDAFQTAYYVWLGGDDFERDPSYFKVYLAWDRAPSPAQSSQVGHLNQTPRPPARSVRFTGSYFNGDEQRLSDDDDDDYVADRIKKEPGVAPSKSHRERREGSKVFRGGQADSNKPGSDLRNASFEPISHKSAFSLPAIYGSQLSTPTAASPARSYPSAAPSLKRKLDTVDDPRQGRIGRAETAHVDEYGDEYFPIRSDTASVLGGTRRWSASKAQCKLVAQSAANEPTKDEDDSERMFIDDGAGMTLVVNRGDLQPTETTGHETTMTIGEQTGGEIHTGRKTATRASMATPPNLGGAESHNRALMNAQNVEASNPLLSNTVFLFKCGASTRAKSFIYCNTVGKLFAHAAAVGIFGHGTSTGELAAEPGQSDLLRTKVGRLRWKYIVRGDREEFEEILQDILHVHELVCTGKEEITCIVLVTRA